MVRLMKWFGLVQVLEPVAAAGGVKCEKASSGFLSCFVSF